MCCCVMLLLAGFGFLLGSFSKHFHRRMVSSELMDATVLPSGLRDMFRMRPS